MAKHKELHYSQRTGWLRAAVMGANDGIVSTASLLVGVAAASTSSEGILLAGLAGLVAGAMSMAAGEYVSVSSQADTEKADLVREAQELENDSDHELLELATIYRDRGLDNALALQVAEKLMEHDALAAHARDELGLTDIHAANPIQAAFASALTFSLGAALPLLVAIFSTADYLVWSVSLVSIVCLALLGAVSANAGGANMVKGALRVTFWGGLAMAATALVGSLFGTVL